MIKKIKIAHYKKITDMEFDFTPGINVISGTNGTCKTSLLHIVGNAFQAVTMKCSWVADIKCLQIIGNVNSILNPKIESLAKGDKRYNDPSNGYRGTLFDVEYVAHQPLAFRKHNSKTNNRYAIKPFYSPGSHDSLPLCPVIYLGLTRLFPFGEYRNEDEIKRVKKILPEKYQQEIATLFDDFTHISISSATPQKMGDIKMRTDFSSTSDGVDSNTISSGEDNLYILFTALVSLRYYFESIESENDIGSILLIDELDATLHPSYQSKLVELFRRYSFAYKIQIVFTTHSLSLIEHCLKRKDNVIYLIDNITSVVEMDSPDIYKIKMNLHDSIADDIYNSKRIPIFTEDEEARIFLELIFEYLTRKRIEFGTAFNLFHLVKANIGGENLKNIFSDMYLIRSTMQAICILDGDHQGNLNHYTTTLPGGGSPEKLIMDYSIELYQKDDDFWVDETIVSMGYVKVYYANNIKPDVDGIEKKLNDLKECEKSTHGVEREERKKVFKVHRRFFELLFKHWLNNRANADQINKFYDNLHKLFCKTAEFHGINPALWSFSDLKEEEVE